MLDSVIGHTVLPSCLSMWWKILLSCIWGSGWRKALRVQPKALFFKLFHHSVLSSLREDFPFCTGTRRERRGVVLSLQQPLYFKNKLSRIYNGILLSHKNERNCVICSDVEESRVCHTEWSKSEREKQISYINAYIGNLEKWYWWTYLQARKETQM